MARPIGRELVLQTALRLTSTVMQAVTLIALARMVGVVAFGYFSAAITVGAILSGLLGLGLSSRVLLLSGDDRLSDTPWYVALGLISSMAVAAGVGIYGLATGHASHFLPIAAAAMFAGGDAYVTILQNLLYGSHRSGRGNLLLFARRCIPLALVAIAYFVARGQAYLLLGVGYAASVIVGLILVGSVVPRDGNWRRVVTESRSYWSANGWAMLQQLDVPLITSFIGAGAAGTYSAAQRLASPVHLITNSLVSIYTPKLSHADDPALRRELAQRLSRSGLLLAVALCLGSIIGPWIGPLLFGEEFNNHAWLFAILIANAALSLVSQLQSAVLFASGQAVFVSRCTAIATAFGLSVVAAGCLAKEVYVAAAGTTLNQLLLLCLLTWGVSQAPKPQVLTGAPPGRHRASRSIIRGRMIL